MNKKPIEALELSEKLYIVYGLFLMRFFVCRINSKIRNQYPSIRAEKECASGNRLNKYESEKTVDRSGSSSYPLQSYLHIL
jgi:hypothetical protein